LDHTGNCHRIYSLVHQITDRLTWLPGLVTRLSVGVMFVGTGWGKLHNLQKVIGFFTELGIPAPALQAPFVASVEFFGGCCLVLGLLTRFAAVPLAATMVVALITAKKGDIGGFDDLVGLSEYLYLLLLVWLAIFGAGWLSLDRVIAQRFLGKGK